MSWNCRSPRLGRLPISPQPRSSPLSNTHNGVAQDGAEGVCTFVLTAANAGGAARLSPSRLQARCALVRAKSRNAGLVHVGDASVTRSDPGLAPGRTLGLRGDPKIDLYDVFMVADSAGDGVEVAYAVGPLIHDADWTYGEMIRKATGT